MKIKLHKPTELPEQEPNEPFSVDVITIDEFGLTGVAYYDYSREKWVFHVDTLVDYHNEDEMQWLWYYPPITVKDLTKHLEDE